MKRTYPDVRVRGGRFWIARPTAAGWPEILESQYSFTLSSGPHGDTKIEFDEKLVGRYTARLDGVPVAGSDP